MRPRIMQKLREASRPGTESPSAQHSHIHGPLVAAKLADGPLAGQSVDVATVEGRPPKTVDVDGPGTDRSRYCLAEWEQFGHSAQYTFLYPV